jgi:hypothetical protein
VFFYVLSNSTFATTQRVMHRVKAQQAHFASRQHGVVGYGDQSGTTGTNGWSAPLEMTLVGEPGLEAGLYLWWGGILIPPPSPPPVSYSILLTVCPECTRRALRLRVVCKLTLTCSSFLSLSTK